MADTWRLSDRWNGLGNGADGQRRRPDRDLLPWEVDDALLRNCGFVRIGSPEDDSRRDKCDCLVPTDVTHLILRQLDQGIRRLATQGADEAKIKNVAERIRIYWLSEMLVVREDDGCIMVHPVHQDGDTVSKLTSAQPSLCPREPMSASVISAVFHDKQVAISAGKEAQHLFTGEYCYAGILSSRPYFLQQRTAARERTRYVLWYSEDSEKWVITDDLLLLDATTVDARLEDSAWFPWEAMSYWQIADGQGDFVTDILLKVAIITTAPSEKSSREKTMETTAPQEGLEPGHVHVFGTPVLGVALLHSLYDSRPELETETVFNMRRLDGTGLLFPRHREIVPYEDLLPGFHREHPPRLDPPPSLVGVLNYAAAESTDGLLKRQLSAVKEHLAREIETEPWSIDVLSACLRETLQRLDHRSASEARSRGGRQIESEADWEHTARRAGRLPRVELDLVLESWAEPLAGTPLGQRRKLGTTY